MYTKIIKIFALTFISLVFSTCDLIELKPTDRVDLDTFYSTPSEVESALIGSYIYAFDNVFNDVLFFGNRSSDDLTAPVDGRQTDPLMNRESLNAGTGEASSLWNNSYRVLATLNLLLERIPALKEELFIRPGSITSANRKEEIIGEATFLRAYIFYNLVLFYGDVPLVIEFPKKSDVVSNQVFRTSKEDVMQFVISELMAAEELLPWNHETLAVLPEEKIVQSKGRATKAAAKLLLSRIYLQNEEWQKAIDKSNEIINSGEFQLTSKWTTIFNSPETSGNQNTKESILEIQTKRGTDQFNNTGGYSWFHQDGSPRRGATQEAYDLFEGDIDNPKDVRKLFSMSQVIATPKYIYALKYRNAYPWWDPQDPFNFIPMRLTECYLIVAECLNEISYPNTQALSYINLIRNRARDFTYVDGAVPGIEPYSFSEYSDQSKFRQGIREERRREMMFEGQRWFDLLRYDQHDGTIVAQQVVGITTSDKTLFPIPERERVLNPNLTQNSGY
jgi:starch-binding outer membrane protein, SusD/RagB family